MRLLIVALFLLAGCSEAPVEDSDRPDGPIHQDGSGEGETVPEDIEYVPVEPFETTLTATGIYTRECGTVTGGLSALPDHSVAAFAVGTNASTMSVHADWQVQNPTQETMWLEFTYKQEVLAIVGGQPGFQTEVSVMDLALDDRDVEVRVAEPECGGAPATVVYYDGVELDVELDFA